MPVTIDPLAPAEAVKYWKGKAPVSAKEFQAMDGAARSRAFAVSGLAKADQIGAMQAAIGKAIEDGETLADFKARIGDVLKDQGWTGQKAWRVENIFRTNIQSAYMAGRYEQMKRVAQARPYWRYSAVMDRRTRPAHRALHGMVYPHDHPFWDQFYPPNGFMCRCTVTTLSARQVKARGLTVQTDIPDRVKVTDPATGMESFVTPIPDKGWATNVGKDWLAGLTPAELEGDLKSLATRALCHTGQFADDPCRPSLATLDQRHVHTFSVSDLLPASLGKEDQVLAFLKEFGLKGLDASGVHTLRGGFPLVISKWLFTDKATGTLKSTWSDKGPYMRLLARTIKDPFEVWWQPVEIGPQRRTVYALRLLRLFRREGERTIGGFCSFSLLGGRQWQGATAFMPKAGRSQKAIYEYLEAQRGGVLVYREK